MKISRKTSGPILPSIVCHGRVETKPTVNFAWPRRTLLGAIAGMGAAAALGSFIRASVQDEISATSLAQRVITVLGHGRSSGIFMSASTEHTSAELLAQILAVDDQELEKLRHVPEQALRKRIHGNVQSDFLAGNVTALNGWWISNTEARCLQLIDLLCGAGVRA